MVNINKCNFSFSFKFDSKKVTARHCVKSVSIRSNSGPFLLAFGLNTDQNNSEHGHFLRSETTNNEILKTHYEKKYHGSKYTVNNGNNRVHFIGQFTFSEEWEFTPRPIYSLDLPWPSLPPYWNFKSSQRNLSTYWTYSTSWKWKSNIYISGSGMSIGKTDIL